MEVGEDEYGILEKAASRKGESHVLVWRVSSTSLSQVFPGSLQPLPLRGPLSEVSSAPTYRDTLYSLYCI
jgi:hypothetical protein